MSVPPLGHAPEALRTIVDAGLCTEGTMLVSGGGHPDCQCWIRVETLLRMEGTEVADVVVGDGSDSDSDDSSSDDDGGGNENSGTATSKASRSTEAQQAPSDDLLSNSSSSARTSSSPPPPPSPKPFFPLEPPHTRIAAQVLSNKADPPQSIPLQSHRTTLFGRINGVRQLAKRLVFVDLAPPDYMGTGTKKDSFDLPWRSGVDGQDMAVQLIAGKTLCQKLGDVEGPKALKHLKPGKLILVDAKTNVGNRSSLQHWIDKRSLDLVVFGFQIIPDELHNAAPAASSDNHLRASPPTTNVSAMQRITNAKTIDPNIEYLQLSDILTDAQSAVQVVDDWESVQAFAKDIQTMLCATPTAAEATNSPILIGIDCEWKPSFLLESSEEEQPVTVLQMAFHPLDKVYILDTQVLCRQCLSPTHEMNDTETMLSNALARLFSSEAVVKVGFQLFGDLQRLASSFPHMTGFQHYSAVIEVSTVVRNAMAKRRTRKARVHISSLGRVCQFLLNNKVLNKAQQTSNWSSRPLTSDQIVYAALDAAVSPVLLNKAMELVHAKIVLVDKHAHGDGGGNGNGDSADNHDANRSRQVSIIRIDGDGDDHDESHKSKHDPTNSIMSCRFIFPDNKDRAATKRAKSIVSKHPVISMRWATHRAGPVPDQVA